MSYKYSKVSKTKQVYLGSETLNQVSTGLLTASVMSVNSTILNRVTTSSSYKMNYSHYFIGVDTVNATGSVYLNLPSATGSLAGRSYVIKDETGLADINNIYVQVSGSDSIDGESFIILESPYASINVYTDGISKWFVY